MILLENSKKLLVLFILTCLLSNSGLFFVDAIGPGGSITYSGYVRDENNVGISGSTVDLYVNDDLVPVHSQTTTSNTGWYSLTRSYETEDPLVDIALYASKDGYVQGNFGDYVASGSYTHNFVLVEESIPEPSLSWVSPASNALITFPPSNNDFSFTYSADNLDYVRLFIGPTGSSPTIQFGTDYTNTGSSISKTVDIGSHMGDLHGLVRADLRGYESSSVVIEASRTFNFSKQISIETELLESGQEDMGSKLLLILYDPPGDQSYSTYTTESKTVMMNSLSAEFGGGCEVHLKAEEFGVGVTSKVALDITVGGELGWGSSIVDIEELTSSLNSAERDLVGPGYGDLYYGELLMLIYEMYASKITYSDSTVVYTNPVSYFAVDYSESVLFSHQYAPNSWLQQNPNINTALSDDPNVVNWFEINSEIQGGTGYREVTHETTNTTSWGWSFAFSISYSTQVKLRWGASEVNVHFQTKYEYDYEHTDSIKTLYHIQDDDSDDYFHYDVGTDKRFGAPIFRNYLTTNPLLQSKSSSPWEYNTRDVIPPDTTYPVITLNTDGDGYSPSEGDTPLVELTIIDEADISIASLIYSHDDGAHWNTINMVERLNDPDSWYANIVSHAHDTEVLWYIFITDTNDNSKTVLDIDSNFFSYTVVNRPCEVQLTSPNGGGTYSESILIEWSGSDLDGDSLTYSIGYKIGGGSWTLITSGLTNTSYIWDISQIADSDTVSVIVYADDSYGSIVSDDSDFVFEIDNENVPEVTLVAPLSGFTYEGVLTINWELVDIDEFVTGFELYYLPASGEPVWLLIDDSITANILTFDWDTSVVLYSQTVRLKVVALNSLDENVESISGLLAIDNRPTVQMSLINPNGGEIFTGNCSITWNVDYTNPLVTYQISLEYSSDSEVWTSIVSDINGTTYIWDTTNIPTGTNYRVRITLTGSYLGVELNSIVDISENAFTIMDEITIPSTTNSIAIPFSSLFALFVLVLVPLVLFKKRK